MQSYNKLLTKNEEQLQFLLKVVSDLCSAYPDARKITLTQQKKNERLSNANFFYCS